MTIRTKYFGFFYHVEHTSQALPDVPKLKTKQIQCGIRIGKYIWRIGKFIDSFDKGYNEKASEAFEYLRQTGRWRK